MRIAFAASLSLLLASPTLASSVSTMHVGLVVTGSFASSLVGTWDSRSAARGNIYHFVVSGSSGLFYELVSIPLRETSPIAAQDTLGDPPTAGTCDLRVSGVIYSLEQTSGTTIRASGDHHLGSSYEMQFRVVTRRGKRPAHLVVALRELENGVEECRRTPDEGWKLASAKRLFLLLITGVSEID